MVIFGKVHGRDTNMRISPGERRDARRPLNEAASASAVYVA